jgi:Nucleotidyltransferase domain
MRDKEYPPLYPEGFRDIEEKDLHKIFVAPFNEGVVHRTGLLLNFVQFFKRFKRLGLPAEIWLDGSFATYAPDPSDVDIVFFIDKSMINNLSNTQYALFVKLFSDRKFIKRLYRLEVFIADQNDANEKNEWFNSFGTYYDEITPKGIFRLNFKQ